MAGSAPAAVRRWSASRTGMALAPKASASAVIVTVRPGSISPFEINRGETMMDARLHRLTGHRLEQRVWRPSRAASA